MQLPVLVMTPAHITQVLSDKSYRFFLSRSILGNKAPADMHEFLVEMRDIIYNNEVLVDHVYVIGMMFFRNYLVKLSMDRDYFELSIKDMADKTVGFTHLLSWQYCYEIKGFSFDSFEKLMIGFLISFMKEEKGAA